MKQRTLTTSCGRRGFTLVELLVTISIFVLMLGLAVPVFRTLTGSRSIESGTNTVSAMLNRVRMDAIGKQEYRGVMFYLDQGTGRVGMVTLREIEAGRVPPAAPAMSPPPWKRVLNQSADCWLDLVTDVEPVLLPPGVGLETVIGNIGGNRYIGFNDINDGGGFMGGPTAYYTCSNRPGGVVAFDPTGRLVAGTPGIVWWDCSTGSATQLGTFMFGTNYIPGGVAAEPAGSSLFMPTLAIALFESEPYLLLPPGTRFGGAAPRDGYEDDYTSYAVGSAEYNKEQWLDNNATPFLINRYNGTLIKGE